MAQVAQKKERLGEMLIFIEVLIYSLFPVVINYSSKIMPPIFFAAISILIAAFFMFFYTLFKGKIKEVLNKKALKYIIGVTVTIIIIPSILIYKGTEMTSGVNTAILIQSEMLFAFILCRIFLKEKITKEKILSAIFIFLGASIVLYNGSFSFNLGDLMLIAGTILYPIGNIFAKKTLQIISPEAIVFARNLLGGLSLLAISFLFENISPENFNLSLQDILLILVNGIVIMAISKIIWYEGIKRMDISKATIMGMSYPAFSLIFAFLLLHEFPSFYQVLGLLVMSLGLYLIILKKPRLKEASASLPN